MRWRDGGGRAGREPCGFPRAAKSPAASFWGCGFSLLAFCSLGRKIRGIKLSPTQDGSEDHVQPPTPQLSVTANPWLDRSAGQLPEVTVPTAPRPHRRSAP